MARKRKTPRRISLIDFESDPTPTVDTSWRADTRGGTLWTKARDWPPASRVIPQNGWEFTDKHPRFPGVFVLAKEGREPLHPNSVVTVAEVAEIRGVPQSAIYKTLPKGKWRSAIWGKWPPDYVPMWTLRAWEILYWRVIRKGEKRIAGAENLAELMPPADTHEDSIDDD